MHTFKHLATAAVLLSISVGSAHAKSIWDQLNETAPLQPVFEDLRQTAPLHAIFEDLRSTAPVRSESDGTDSIKP